MERILVTGGSGGIGSEVCRQLPRLGYEAVVAYAQNTEKALAVARECGGVAIPLDLTNDSSIDAAVTLLAESNKPMAGVILAASPTPLVAPLSKQSTEHRALQWQINVAGPTQLMTALIAKCFRPRKAGTVIGVLTEAMGLEGTPASHMSSYVIAKYGQLGLLSSLRAEFPWLTVASVSPSYTETPMLSAFEPRFLELLRTQREFLTPEVVAGQIVAKFPTLIRRAS